MSTTISTATRADIHRITPYSPGKPIEEVARELGLDPATIIKLASNENPLGPSPKAVEAMRAHLEDVRLYPETDGFPLRVALAEFLGVDKDQVSIGRGSDEIDQMDALGGPALRRRQEKEFTPVHHRLEARRRHPEALFPLPARRHAL